jgi:hypothetical protein
VAITHPGNSINLFHLRVNRFERYIQARITNVGFVNRRKAAVAQLFNDLVFAQRL